MSVLEEVTGYLSAGADGRLVASSSAPGRGAQTSPTTGRARFNPAMYPSFYWALAARLATGKAAAA